MTCIHIFGQKTDKERGMGEQENKNAKNLSVKGTFSGAVSPRSDAEQTRIEARLQARLKEEENGGPLPNLPTKQEITTEVARAPEVTATEKQSLKEGFNEAHKTVEKQIQEHAFNNIAGEHFINGQHFPVSKTVALAFAHVEHETGIPSDVMIHVCARESSCDPDSVNKYSGAIGLFQFMTNNQETLYETLYKRGDNAGFSDHKALVERYVKNKNNGNPILGHRPVDDEARITLDDLARDPYFNTKLWAAKTTVDIEKYENWLGNREATNGEIVVMNNLGRVGLQKFVKQAWEDKKTGEKTLAADFFVKHKKLFGGDVGESNRTLVKHENGEYKTVRESYNDIMNNFGGWNSLETKPTILAQTTTPNAGGLSGM